MTFLCNKVYMYRKVCTYVLISQMSNCSEKSQKSCRLIYVTVEVMKHYVSTVTLPLLW